jgi:hypothetical protein
MTSHCKLQLIGMDRHCRLQWPVPAISSCKLCFTGLPLMWMEHDEPQPRLPPSMPLLQVNSSYQYKGGV